MAGGLYRFSVPLLPNTRLALGMGAAAALMSLAGLTHVMALVEGLMLCTLVLLLDRSRLNWRNVSIVIFVAGLVFAPWVLYLSANPEIAKAQWSVNAGARKADVFGIVKRVVTDPWERYWFHHVAYARGLERGVISPVLALAVCFVMAVLHKRVRGASGYLFTLCGVAWFVLAAVDGPRSLTYYVHVFPVYTAAAAVVLCRLWDQGFRSRWIVAIVATALVLPGVGFAYKVSQNSYKTEYMTAVGILKRITRPGDVVIAGSEFNFGLGFDSNFVDDQELRLPSTAVYVDNDIWKTNHPGAWQDRVRAELATDYVCVYRTPRFRIYLRSDLAKQRL